MLAKLLRPLMILLVLACPLCAQENASWTEAFPPFRIAGNVYYVGSKDLASYLITTSKGNIIINSNLETSVPQIRESVEKLGFRFQDTKILLISHAHWDHNAGSALLKEATGAEYMVMDADAPEVESGGKGNFHYTKLYQPAKVDRVLHDGDKVKLGDTVLTAHLTPGHTRGCTTWTLQVHDSPVVSNNLASNSKDEAGKPATGNNAAGKSADGKSAKDMKTYNVVIIGSPNVNAGFKLVNNDKYPQIASDYERTFRVLKSLPCDVFLSSHGSHYGMAEKYARMKPGEANPFLDPAGYKAYVANREEAFRKELAKQMAEAK
jgi:metallo-beta-lactamase class B